MIRSLKAAIVLNQVLSVSQTLLCMAAILYIDVVGVWPLQYLVLCHSFLGLLPDISFQFVKVAHLLSL